MNLSDEYHRNVALPAAKAAAQLTRQNRDLYPTVARHQALKAAWDTYHALTGRWPPSKKPYKNRGKGWGNINRSPAQYLQYESPIWTTQHPPIQH